MNVVFTICSNNYLAHAKTLGDSFLIHHPNTKFIIGLVDTFNPDLDYSIFSAFEIIPVDTIGVPDLKELTEKYNITELNTAVKPTYLHYIFQKYKAEKVLYIDPDIMVFSPLDEVFEILNTKNIVITPHMCSPTEDDLSPTDYHVLRGGVYNLGFVGLSNYEQIKGFIDWWHDRVVKYGFANIAQGMFYDQLWINYVPTFYDNYFILKHPGYNMANWNLHERLITSAKDGQYMINNTYPLRFFHFSGYKFKKPEVMSVYLTRYDFQSRPDLLPIFTSYQKALEENDVFQISKLKVFYYPGLNAVPKKIKKRNLIEKVLFRIKTSLKVLIKGHY